jgi:hypothetical protein
MSPRRTASFLTIVVVALTAIRLVYLGGRELIG